MIPSLSRGLFAVVLSLGVFVMGAFSARAVNVWPDSNPWTLAEALLGRGGVTIRSATYLGANGAAGLYSAGPLDIKDGIVMSSGQISGIPNVGQFISSSNGQPGDALCNQLASPYTSQDRARLEIVFDLAPGYDGIQFSYISGTEEFPDYVGSTFNDPVGVFLNGVNVALDDSVPPAPITLNGPFYENFARVIQSPNTQTAFNGSTPLLTNRAPLTGGSINNVLVVVVCDMTDSSYDTGIFLTALQGCVGNCQGVSWCGDAKLTPGPEQCDDGNNVNGDGCNVGCEVEPGWVCTGVAGARSVCQLGCGNGSIQPPEECDDGNSINNDGCTNSCKLPKCTDDIRNQNETDVDCGGSCPDCINGEQCLSGNDCQSNYCLNGVCATPNCTDNVKNGAETGVDCGGPCPGCSVGNPCGGHPDCASGLWCINSICRAPTCTDGIKNGAETGVDCGGPTCGACGTGQGCGQASHCVSGVCTGGICQAATCSDGVRNGSETGVDCGGPTCGACGTGQGCGQASHCVSGVCTGGICQAATCSDGVRNGQETAVDCGGPTCGPCGNGSGCGSPTHCISGVCTGGICQAPTCTDGVRNGQETGLDCGGPTCGPCGNGLGCGQASHCISGVCTGGICQVPTCSDGVKNGQETGLDCGGPTCGACGTGQGCGTAAHCISGVCTGGICQAPTCSDGVKNGQETGLDCGGPTCGPCGTGQGCGTAAHCISGVCTGGICQAPTCSDGVKNGQETGLDCGGPTCGPCGTGQGCGLPSHCVSGVCTAGICQAATCSDAVKNGQETAIDCGGPTCGPCGNGLGCGQPSHCISGVCTGGICQVPTCSDGVRNGQETAIDCGGPTCGPCGNGLGCGQPSHCISGVCTGGICQVPTCTDGVKNGLETGVDCGGPTCGQCGTGQGCGQPSHCISGVCTGGICQAATCSDGVRNGQETAIDCGGPTCGPCGNGLGCGQASHCISGVCTGGICQVPTCSDGVKNGLETGQDCGGPTCGPCGTGQGCGLASHCISGVCTGNICQAPACNDNVKNGNETSKDCGGSCPPCANGGNCNLANDCQSSFCIEGICCNESCGAGNDCRSCDLPGKVGICSYLNLPNIDDGGVCDGVDNDCDGQTDENFAQTATSCGVGECARAGNLFCANGQIGDTCLAGAPSPEVCDGKDNDCDGVSDAADNSLVRIPCDKQAGVCAGSVRSAAQCVNGAWQACPGSLYASHAFPHYATTDGCDGRDNDCDNLRDEDHLVENTSCGTGSCRRTGQRICSNGAVINTCAAGSAAANDTACNGADDDCNGQTDEDYVTAATTCGVGACRRNGQAFCINGGVVDSCEAGSPSADTTCNGVDDDCDGSVDEHFPATATSCGVGECRRTGTITCQGGSAVDSCAPGAPSAEVCDGKDNDCDGLVDGADPDLFLPNCEKQGGVCAGLKKTPSLCVAGAWQSCSDAFYLTNRPAYSTSDTCDAVDTDCDGQVDEDFAAQATSCGVGECRRTGTTTCSGGVVGDSCASANPSAEVCDGKDNDCDGQTDGADGDLVLVACEKQDGACEGLLKTASLCVGGAWQVCNDAFYTEQLYPYYSVVDVCDGNDSDCDGTMDEDYVAQPVSCGVGECLRTGTTQCVRGEVEESCTAGAPSAEVCDNKDNDCDGQTDGADGSLVLPSCEKQSGVCAGVTKTANLCVNGAWQPCGDAVYGAARFGQYSLADLCDGLNNDCDTLTDEDHDTVNTTCGKGACARTGQRICQLGAVLDTCMAGPPAASDSSCNNVDDDCDGQTDEHYLPPATTCGTGGCLRSGLAYCVQGQVYDSCNASTPLGSDINCNGLDDDCDGRVDEDFMAGQLCVVGQGACERTGSFMCTAGGVVCDISAGVPSPEVCDGVDNDCDGSVDEGVVGSICQRKDTAILSAPSAVTAARSASFTFHDPLDASATAFQCSLDGGAWVRCDGGAISYSGLSDGDHSFLVRSVGPDGAVDSTPAFHAWRVDQGQPDTLILVGPSDPSQSTTANFVFGTTATAVDTYRCALDPVLVPPPTAAFAPCDAVTRMDDLSEGSHTMWVYVVSATGVADPTPATHTWVIDLSAPETEIAQGPEPITASPSAAFVYRSPGEDSITAFRCRLDGGEWTACDGGEAVFEGLSDGEYTFEVSAIDSTGIADPTPASWSWEVDTMAPDTFITIRPDNPSQNPAASFAFASDEREVSYRCVFDLEEPPPVGDAAWQPCDQTLSMSELAAGSHTLHVAAVDAAGQWDPSPASWTWVIDLTAPETLIDSRPPVQTGPTDGAVFTWSSSIEDAYYECSVDGGPWQRCDSGTLVLDAATLSIGDHSFQVRACTNTSGLCDPTPAVASWTITTSNCPLDAVAPTLSCPSGGTWECMGGGRAWFDLEPVAATDPCGVQDVSDVLPQTYGLGTTPIVRAVQDGNRNRASCVTEVTVVDTTPPVITCGQHVVVQTDPGVCGAVVALEQPEASDTCHHDLVVFNNAPQVFPVGSTVVVWTALDPSGHTASCEVVVTVEDREESALDCMEERIVDAPADLCGWSGSLVATARDNCAVEVSTLSQERTFPIGEVDVLFTSTDTNNNVS
ncbi:MAG TPA: MopE-related protein, partial [Myxococcota bacterium]|nr:MopE-related protein [Myxococcota bacterium]